MANGGPGPWAFWATAIVGFFSSRLTRWLVDGKDFWDGVSLFFVISISLAISAGITLKLAERESVDEKENEYSKGAFGYFVGFMLPYINAYISED